MGKKGISLTPDVLAGLETRSQGGGAAASVVSESDLAGFNFEDGSQYSFRAAVERRVKEEPLEPAAAAASADGGQCRCCDASKLRSSPFCAEHKKAYQNLMNFALKKTKGKDGAYVNPEAAENFEKIFGRGRAAPPDMMLANRVVLDQRELNKGTKEKGKQSFVDLGTYEHSRGFRQSKGVESGCPMWEKEVFATQMRNLRGWDQKYAEAQWEALAIDATETDNGGWNGAKRIEILANLAGRDEHRTKRENFEQKAWVESSKAKKGTTVADKNKILEETGSGFSALRRPMSEASLRAPLARGAITDSQSGSSLSLADRLAAAATQVAPELHAQNLANRPGVGGVALGSSSGSQPAKGQAAEPSPQEPEGPKKLDPIDRTKVLSKCSDELEADVNKLVRQLKECATVRRDLHAAVAEDVVDTMNERVAIAEHFVGSMLPDLTPVDESAAESIAIDQVVLAELVYKQVEQVK